MAKELTGAQVVGAPVFAVPGAPPEPLLLPLPKSYATYRAMRKHPTLALARGFSAAAVVGGKWAVESTDDAPEGAVEFITQQLIPWRRLIVERSMLGGNVDFGWQPFEVVYDVQDGAEVVQKIKPLLHDITEILVVTSTGQFAAFRQNQVITVPASDVLLVSFRVEGTQWYGESLLENARETFNEWREANAGAARYDKKLAGTHVVVTYPVGTSPDAGGTEVDNAVHAKNIVNAMQSNGAAIVPRITAEQDDLPAYAGDKHKGAWTVEFLSDKGAQASFVDRLNYLDRQLVRAIGYPERAILEGQFGTKAEASAHQDLAVTSAELSGDLIADAVNKQIVQRLLRMNYGPAAEKSVWIKQAPLADDKRAMLQSLYEKLLDNPASFAEEFLDVDTSAIRKMLGIPELKNADDVEPDAGDEGGDLRDDLLPSNEGETL